MNIWASDTSVRASIIVEAPISRAFKVFTEDFGSFKPAEHNMLKVEIAETVFEPKVGGFLYDRGIDGSVCRWARVLAYEPPNRLLLSWDISPQWQIEEDPLKTSEWEVRFIAETPPMHAGRDRAPQSRTPRRGLAKRPRGRGRRAGLAALPAAVRRLDG